MTALKVTKFEGKNLKSDNKPERYKIDIMQDLAREFDVVIIGTGPAESMISGALSMNKKTVINFDKNSLYGGCRRTFNINEFIEYVTANGTIETNRVTEFLGEKYRASAFCIDLMPSIIHSKDGLVKLLIDSGSSESINITTIEGMYFPSQGQFRSIPCSKAAIFGDKIMSYQQKAKSMKFISSFLPDGEYGHQVKNPQMQQLIEENGDKPFAELLAKIGFDDDLQKAFEYFVAAANAPILTKEAVPRFQKFIESIGVYGPSPYISFFYGCADVPQIFSRISAVYGGIFILNNTADEPITKDENGLFHIKVKDIGDVTTKMLIVGGDQVPYPEGTPRRLLAHREVLVVKESLLPAGRSVLVVPPGRYGNPKPVWIMQFDKSMGIAEQGYYVIHFISMGEVKTTSDRLLELNPDFAAQVMLRASFDATEYDQSPVDGAIFVKSPTADDFIVGFEYFVEQAKDIVAKINPEIPFYPPPTEVEVEVPIQPEEAQKPAENASESAPAEPKAETNETKPEEKTEQAPVEEKTENNENKPEEKQE